MWTVIVILILVGLLLMILEIIVIPGSGVVGIVGMASMIAGIWLDNHKAYIVYLNNGDTNMIRLDSEVEDYRIHGGAAAPSPFGSHDAVSEKRFLERKKQQLSSFFHKVIEKVEACEAIYICGPAEAKKGLNKEIGTKMHLKGRIARVEACDSMTENQIIARVKSFFNKLQ